METVTDNVARSLMSHDCGVEDFLYEGDIFTKETTSAVYLVTYP